MPKVTVSDHAVLRYIERIHGIDVERIRHEMMPKELAKAIDMAGGCGKFPTGECRYVVRDNTVVTVGKF